MRACNRARKHVILTLSEIVSRLRRETYSNILGLSQNEICDRQRSFGLMVTDVECRGIFIHGRR